MAATLAHAGFTRLVEVGSVPGSVQPARTLSDVETTSKRPRTLDPNCYRSASRASLGTTRIVPSLRALASRARTMRDKLLAESYDVLRRILCIARPHRRLIEFLEPGAYAQAAELVERIASAQSKEALKGVPTRDCPCCGETIYLIGRGAPAEGPCVGCAHSAAVAEHAAHVCADCGHASPKPGALCWLCVSKKRIAASAERLSRVDDQEARRA